MDDERIKETIRQMLADWDSLTESEKQSALRWADRQARGEE